MAAVCTMLVSHFPSCPLGIQVSPVPLQSKVFLVTNEVWLHLALRQQILPLAKSSSSAPGIHGCWIITCCFFVSPLGDGCSCLQVARESQAKLNPDPGSNPTTAARPFAGSLTSLGLSFLFQIKNTLMLTQGDLGERSTGTVIYFCNSSVRLKLSKNKK